MVAGLSFKKVDRQTDATGLADIYTIIYEDNTGNKYTFGVENGTNTFNIFKYEPNSGGEVDYSAIAKNFMTNGAVGGLLGKLTTIETATNAANLGDKVAAIKTKTDSFTADVADIKAKTDKMPDDLETELGKLATSASLSTLDGKVDTIKTETDKITAIETNVGAIQTKTDKITDTLGADVTAIKAKTDKMPDDLQEKLDALPGFEYIDTLVVPLAKTADVADIKAKTDKMPADLDAELGKLAKSAELAPLAKTAELAPLAKTADVADIKAKTDKMPDDLQEELDALPRLGQIYKLVGPLVDPLAKSADVADIKAKTDKMPADLNAELTKLTTIAETLNGSPQAAAAAKAVLESSFKKAIEEAGEDGSKWLKNEIKEIVSQPSFEIPQDSSEALSWDW